MITDLCRYKDGSWRMYDLYCRVPELRELARTNRALAFAIAHYYAFTDRRPKRPIDAVRRLARMRRRDALAALGFPGTESFTRILSRFGDRAVTLERLLRLRAAVAHDPGIPARLAHAPRLEEGLLAVASSRLFPLLSNRALLDLAAAPAIARSKAKTIGLLIDTVRMMRRLGRDDVLFRRWADVQEAHDDLAERFVILATSHENEPFELDGLPAGIDAPGIRIEPIVDTDDLAREAAAMGNCLASPDYAEGAIKGRSGFYRMLLPERASIQVLREPPGDHWVVKEMMGEDNDWVGRDAVRAAEKWLRHENWRLGLTQLELDFNPHRGVWSDLATKMIIEKYGLRLDDPDAQDAPFEHVPVLPPQVIALLSPHGPE